MNCKDNIVVYRNDLLRPSETFIQSQSRSLRRFNCFYVGTRRVEGLLLPEEKVITVDGPRLSQKMNGIIYKLTGFSSRLYQQVKSLSPKLIHAHFGPDAVRAIPLSVQLDIPLVVTFHGYELSVKPSHAWRASFSQLMYLLNKEKLKKRATHCIAVSDFIGNLLLEQRFSPQKISTQYIGIDTSLFIPDESIRRTSTILFVGRLVEMKGCEYLLRAVSKIQAISPTTELVIVGDGPLRSQLEVMAHKILQNYHFLGFQPSSVVREWMNKSKVFCVPSITARNGHSEAFGIVFAEAQAMGLPVVSFDSGGISEAVAHCETGFLVSEKDVDALSESILSLLKNSELWQDMSKKAAKRVREKFDLHCQSEQLEGLYSQIIDQY